MARERTTPEVDRSLKPTDGDHVAARIRVDAERLIGGPAADASGPEVLATYPIFRHEGIPGSETADRATPEIHGAREVATDGHVAARIDRDAGCTVVARASDGLDPQIRALSGVLGDEDVGEAGARDRAASEVGRALEVTGDDHISTGRHGDTVACIFSRAADELRPLAGARGATEAGHEGVVAARGGRHDAAPHVQTAADLPRHDDVAVRHCRHAVAVVFEAAAESYGPEVVALWRERRKEDI